MRIAFVARFAPGWASERDLAVALRRAGHAVTEKREDASTRNTWHDPAQWDFDLVIWTPADLRRGNRIEWVMDNTDLPVVFFHLDRFWGLPRERYLTRSAVMRCDLVVTADGGHDGAWVGHGVTHEWLPPAVDRDEAMIEAPHDPSVPPVVFVGSVEGYHPSWPHRQELVTRLRGWYGADFGLYPRHGVLLRGSALSSVIQSAEVVVGDSCLVGGVGRYWSDRIPDTLGRCGFLVHPEVDGMDEHFDVGRYLITWPVGDWDRLQATIDHWRERPDERAAIAADGRAHVLAHHTFDNSAIELIALCAKHGLV